MYIAFVHVLLLNFSTQERVFFFIFVVVVSRAGFGRPDIIIVVVVAVVVIAGVDSRFSLSLAFHIAL